MYVKAETKKIFSACALWDVILPMQTNKMATASNSRHRPWCSIKLYMKMIMQCIDADLAPCEPKPCG